MISRTGFATGSNNMTHMKLPPIVMTVPSDAAFYLGMIQAAFNNRAFCRTQAVMSAALLTRAVKDLNDGILDTRWFDEQAHTDAQGCMTESVRAKISAEKYYKKTKQEFITAFPQYAEVLETMIPGSTQHFEVKSNE